ncbi:MAG: glycosyltransferase family 2 protein [Sulfobacillus acidophilus]|uniref:Glycosyltransferase family 2 protein n=1 Tax=Sulfobacillus acidophilus TaxID=53633 RepID=A0A2T2WCT9_9FIRM|nr:MAG: glycosyltransferase family 2 protein [Sulfobacillus acidophilus]
MVSISVVIPAYNAEKTIADAILSVVAQSVPVQEIIVIDDGSTDSTAQLVQSRFPQVQVQQIANGGPSRARNVGMRMAHGDWIAFLDADDRWHPEKMRIQLAARDGGARLVASDWVRGAEFTSPPDPVPRTQLGYRDLLKMNQFQTSTVLIERGLANVLGGFDSNVDGAEDWDYWLRASRETTIVKVDWPLVQYRDLATGYSKNVWRVYVTMQPMLDKHRETAPVSAQEFSTLEAWHHLRFWVAFGLAHDGDHARAAWHNAIQRRLRRYVPRAAWHYLAPFLIQRMRRRARG